MNKEPSSDFNRWMQAELDTIASEGLLRRRRVVRPLPDGWCEVDGRRLRNFASNDYLNLAGDPRVIEAARIAGEESGSGSRASALIAGRTHWHERLERRLAEFEGTESALLFPTGYAANLGVVAALVGPEDVVFCDRLNHASLVDGCRLSGARLRVYRRDALDRLERELDKARDARRRLIVTDGVFSMDGDVAPLRELCDLADAADAMLLVDEAHGTGVLGERGRGACEAAGVEDRGVIRIGTLSKALGSIGGFVAGSRVLCDWLWNRARPQIFSTAMPPSAAAAALAALDVVESERERRRRLINGAAEFRNMLQDQSVEVVSGGVGPIVPIMVGAPEAATNAAARLEQMGFLVAAVRPPSVPQGSSRLRVALTWTHCDTAVLLDLAKAIVNSCREGLTAAH